MSLTTHCPNPIFCKSASSSGGRVAQMAGSDRPNNLSCFNIAFTTMISAIKWGASLPNHTLGRDIKKLRRKSVSNHLRYLVAALTMRAGLRAQLENNGKRV